MREFHTSVTDLRQPFGPRIETIGYECGWADEAIYFVTAEPATPGAARIDLRVQIGYDDVRWLDEGTRVSLTGPGETFCRVRHFGGFLRLAGEVHHAGSCVLTVRLVLKG